MRDKLMKMLDERYKDMVKIRRDLHVIPEPSFHEEKTAQYILDFYKDKDVKVEHGIGGHGILVTINPESTGKVVALRADFDALPIEEETDVDYISQHEGYMHACGHDGHTAYLMVLADCLITLKDELKATIKIIHQHAEEVLPGGAIDFINAGLLDDADQIYGVHFRPIGPVGTVMVAPQEAMAGNGTYTLKIKGVGGHGSTPEVGNDAITAGAYFILAIQSIISRRISAKEIGVINFGNFDAKGAPNVIQENVEVQGVIRYFKSEVEQEIIHQLNMICDGLEVMFDVKVSYKYERGYPPLINHEKVTQDALKIFEKAEYISDLRLVEPWMASEDFSYYVERIPGTYYFIGGSPEGDVYQYGNHHPKFNFDERAMLIAAKSVADLLLNDIL